MVYCELMQGRLKGVECVYVCNVLVFFVGIWFDVEWKIGGIGEIQNMCWKVFMVGDVGVGYKQFGWYGNVVFF